MSRLPLMILCAVVCAFSAFSDELSAPRVGRIFDGDLSTIEEELVPPAETMPADQYKFAPAHSGFAGVRAFGQQVFHIAAVIYEVSASVLGENNPSKPVQNENGPASPFGKNMAPRVSMATVAAWHSLNHYGQMVVHARMNGTIPPASR